MIVIKDNKRGYSMDTRATMKKKDIQIVIRLDEKEASSLKAIAIQMGWTVSHTVRYLLAPQFAYYAKNKNIQLPESDIEAINYLFNVK